MRFVTVIALAFLLLTHLSGCGLMGEVDQRARYGLILEEHGPVIQTSVMGYYHEGKKPYLDIHTGIRVNSLIYTSEENRHTASASINYYVYKLEDDEYTRVVTRDTNFVVNEEDYDIRERYEFRFIRHQIPVEPGTWKVEVLATDDRSNESNRISKTVEIPSPDAGDLLLTRIKLTSIRGPDSDEQLSSSYDIPSRMDSLEFSYQLLRGNNPDPVDVSMKLIELESDMEPARSMAGPPSRWSSIAYQGIRFDEKTIVERQIRTIEDETELIDIKFRIPVPDRGSYRFEASVHPKDDPDSSPLMKQVRDFGVMSPNHPNVKSIREMAEPLVYLMSRSRHNKMMQIEDNDSLKTVIDQFWIDAGGDARTAQRLIEKYYDRVEEANRQFTNHKAGWKTDMGMIYVLFGEPNFFDKGMNRIQWYYGRDMFAPDAGFSFESAHGSKVVRNLSLTHYILLRHRNYSRLEFRQVQHWLSGNILDYPI